jgi:hypothetical protein
MMHPSPTTVIASRIVNSRMTLAAAKSSAGSPVAVAPR